MVETSEQIELALSKPSCSSAFTAAISIQGSFPVAAVVSKRLDLFRAQPWQIGGFNGGEVGAIRVAIVDTVQ